MAKGFSTSILPQSAMTTSFRGLSRPSVLVLSTFRTTSWEMQKRESRVGQEVCHSGDTGPVYGWGGLRPQVMNSLQTSRSQNPNSHC